jgi:hypothetical protein
VTGRQWWQTAGSVLAVALAGALKLALTPAHPAHVYSWQINTLVLSVVALAGYIGGDACARRWEDKQDEQARRVADVRRADAIQRAADMVITSRPGDDYQGRTCTAEAVREYVLVTDGVQVTLQECAAALDDRLRYRGFRA